MKNLIAFGEGWTSGAELIDIDPDYFAYPELIAHDLNLKYINKAHDGASLSSVFKDLVNYVENTPIQELRETFILIGLPSETIDAINMNEEDMQKIYAETVTSIDELAFQLDLKLLQVNVMTQLRKPKVKTLLNNLSLLEILILRNRPRKNPLLLPKKNPNKNGHSVLSEYLLPEVKAVILA